MKNAGANHLVLPFTFHNIVCILASMLKVCVLCVFCV